MRGARAGVGVEAGQACPPCAHTASSTPAALLHGQNPAPSANIDALGAPGIVLSPFCTRATANTTPSPQAHARVGGVAQAARHRGGAAGGDRCAEGGGHAARAPHVPALPRPPLRPAGRRWVLTSGRRRAAEGGRFRACVRRHEGRVRVFCWCPWQGLDMSIGR